jgi:glycosyltransferase involved in cell wall biosynthesis
MKILVVGQYFWPESFRINEVAESLCRLGCEVSVLTGAPNYPDGAVYAGYSAWTLRSEQRGDVHIQRVPVIPRGGGAAVRLTLNYLSFVVAASALGPWLLRHRRFDAVLVYAPGPIVQAIPGLLMGRLKRAPVVTWVQDLWPESLEATGFVQSRRVLALLRRVVQWIYRRHDLLLVQSRAFVDAVRPMAGAIPVVYHPNPGELPRSSAAETADPMLRLKPGFNVVFAGNLGTVQALETILDAADLARRHTDLHWVLIGSGSRSGWLAEQVARRGLTQVSLPGRFPSEQMAGIFAQASALLVTLKRNPLMSLTVPSKVQAYLAAGRPIVAAIDGEGARVIEEAGAGVTCRAEDSAALYGAVLRLKALPRAELAALGEAGRKYYEENFDADVLTARLVERLSGLVACSRASRSGRAA